MGLDRRAVVTVLGLGTNLGDRLEHLQGALADLEAEGLDLLRVSPVLESRFVGSGAPQPPYLNAVLEVRSSLAPLELLDRLQDIERRHGRQPGTHQRPRPLDLDILPPNGVLKRKLR